MVAKDSLSSMYILEVVDDMIDEGTTKAINELVRECINEEKERESE